MKRTIKKAMATLLAAVMLVCSAPLASISEIFVTKVEAAEEFTSGYYTYTVDDSGNATITGYDYNALDNSNINKIEIPSLIEGYSVVNIGESAFHKCNLITSVTIPKSVVNIECGAFYECYNLESVVICDGVKTLEDEVFKYCNKLVYITLPDSISYIGYEAFYGTGYYNDTENWDNKVLYIGNHLIEAQSDISGEYRIKESTKVIASEAFSRGLNSCDSLSNIVIPDSVISIGYIAFSGCDGLTNVKIPGSVVDIGVSAFSDCKNIESITIENGVKKIGNSAFRGCSSLKKIEIPDSVQSIESDVFDGCTSLTNVKLSANIKTISSGLFYGCKNLSEIIIPDSVKSIDYAAFANCDNLTKVTVSKNVTSIDDYTFRNCKSLIDVSIPSGVKKIGTCAFAECWSIKELTIPASVIEIGAQAFLNCFNLVINVDSLNTHYSSDDGTLFNKDKTVLIQYGKGNNYERYAVPEGVINIGQGAFYWCGITDIIIPASVKSIGDLAFYLCNYLENVYYSGSEEDWNAIIIGTDNEKLINAKIHYNYEGSEIPAEPSNPIIPDEIVKEDVVSKPSTSTINYGDAIFLHIDASKVPIGGRVEWTASNNNFDFEVSADGMTCKITPSLSGDTTFTATVYDASGNAVSKDEQEMTSKSGFFQKIIAFFKKLFRLNKTYENKI